MQQMELIADVLQRSSVLDAVTARSSAKSAVSTPQGMPQKEGYGVMPIPSEITVSLSRKLSRDFQSAGVELGMTVTLEPGDDPEIVIKNTRSLLKAIVNETFKQHKESTE